MIFICPKTQNDGAILCKLHLVVSDNIRVDTGPGKPGKLIRVGSGIFVYNLKVRKF